MFQWTGSGALGSRFIQGGVDAALCHRTPKHGLMTAPHRLGCFSGPGLACLGAGSSKAVSTLRSATALHKGRHSVPRTRLRCLQITTAKRILVKAERKARFEIRTISRLPAL